VDTIVVQRFPALRDTLFTLSDNYLLINLDKLSATIKSRGGEDYEFRVSTGTTTLEKGVQTPEGLFCVLYKAESVRSKQFDNTLMLNWIGFHDGIGLHGLETDGYYRYLGKKSSSHGCVRVSREDINQAYQRIDIGSPILLYRNKPAVTIAFADTIVQYTDYPHDKLTEALRYRQRLLYGGEFLLYQQPKLVITPNNTTNAGLPYGSADSVAANQKIIVKK
jgi:hypothetical protein